MEEWKVFLLVAEVRSLTRAAALRDTAQPVISRQVAQIERKCAAKLFDRNGRGVSLTEAGLRALPKVKALLRDGDQIRAELRASGAQPVGTVRIGVLESMASALAGLLFRRVCSAFPGIQLRMVEASSSRLAEWVHEGQVDIAVLFRHDNRSRPDDQPIADVETVLVGAAADPLTRARTIAFARLDGVPLVLPAETNMLRRALQHVAEAQGIALNVVMECDSLVAQKEAVADGGGYTILGANAMVQDIASGRLRASRLVSPAIRRRMMLCVSPHRPPTLACRTIATLIQNSLSVLLTARGASGRN
ncbi:MAG: LysR family transcriptional regulator [Burkholderiales bacterium]|nr:LysR family transcriptional regulator [Burkholderiales bacterium]